jgi:serine/threonine-protein kinase RsbW
MLRLPSSPNSIKHIEVFAQDLADRYPIGPEKYPNLLISLTEAVNNAICHGNKYDEKKYVNIALREKLKGLAIRVSDEGPGFNPVDVPDPTTSENISKLGGRGVFLIRQLSDNVHFLNEGRTIEMHFNWQ